MAYSGRKVAWDPAGFFAAIVDPDNVANGLREAQVLASGIWTALFRSQAETAALPSTTPVVERDIVAFLAMTAFFFILNWFMRLVIIQPWLQRTFIGDMKMKIAVQQKFAQAFMEMFFYSAFTVLGLILVPRQEWIWPEELWWRGQGPAHVPKSTVVRADLKAYYLSYAARYFQGVLSVCLEHKRKDFLEMIIHHLITVLLVYLSFVWGWNRVGFVVMLLLDPADPFLHIAKMFKYTGDSVKKREDNERLERRKAFFQKMADLLFVIFAIVFFLTRLVMYPFVCWSAAKELYLNQWHLRAGAAGACVLLLCMLQGLQCYWFGLLLKAAYKMIMSGGIEDVRSDTEDEDDEDSTDKKMD